MHNRKVGTPSNRLEDKSHQRLGNLEIQEDGASRGCVSRSKRVAFQNPNILIKIQLNLGKDDIGRCRLGSFNLNKQYQRKTPSSEKKERKKKRERERFESNLV